MLSLAEISFGGAVGDVSPALGDVPPCAVAGLPCAGEAGCCVGVLLPPVSPALGGVLPCVVALVFPWGALPGSCDDGFVGGVEPWGMPPPEGED
ncbi:hypothetical protein BE18_27095 [Sorangium cellulosum]|uniref:Uncharacterized protein n=1 Tax=Sorangium cellulosum TaxID=56 RepID=A0A150RAG5_SORCE|nr:hypothetical protein BE18_27095 [Sorangium cellulosum]